VSIVESIRRESRFLSIVADVAWRTRKLRPSSSFTTADLVEQWADRTPDAEAICFEGRRISYAEYDAWGNRYAHWARRQGIQAGDVVALLMENRPEYLFCWLGLAKLGAIGALINTNLSGSSLAHCLRVSQARHLVLGAELLPAWKSARELLEEKPKVWLSDGAPDPASNFGDLDRAVASEPSEPMPGLRDDLQAGDKLFYIYTSGTTGNPKAANISHHRFLQVAYAFAALSRATARDRMYVVLPLYHSAGGLCAVGISLAAGATVVLRRKFSASHFFGDCREERVTLFQYIGELCRYLLNSPADPDERRHQIRLCVGNGLRPDIWEAFQERFQIPDILEFYGATEGNVALFNADGRVGAIGRVPPLLERLSPVKLVRFDLDDELPVRGPDGFCIECGPGEVGEAIGRIPKSSDSVLGRFEGYTDKSATEKKILSGVFERDDAWFRTGDLLRRDEDGYYYFVDRVGDTFRWKGENVSTSEVSAVLGGHPGVREANVYGVEVPGADGRAGMASLVVDSDFDLQSIRSRLESELASYARPLFIRLQPQMEVTGTFKHRKLDLVAEGFDPGRVADRLYFADPETKSFVPLDLPTYRRIVDGDVRI
jgi:fatty-acyl-CoA synthase